MLIIICLVNYMMKINVCNITKTDCNTFDILEDTNIHTLKCMIREKMGYDVDTMVLVIDHQQLTDETLNTFNFEEKEVYVLGKKTNKSKFNRTYKNIDKSNPKYDYEGSYEELIEKWKNKLLNIYATSPRNLEKLIKEHPYLQKLIQITYYKTLVDMSKSEYLSSIDPISLLCYEIIKDKKIFKLNEKELQLTLLTIDDIEYLEKIKQHTNMYSYDELVSLYLMCDRNIYIIEELIND